MKLRIVNFLYRMFKLFFPKSTITCYLWMGSSDRIKQLREMAKDRMDWKKELRNAGGQKYYDNVPVSVVPGIYKAQWFSSDGQEFWFDVGITGDTFNFVGREVSLESPKSISEFKKWFGPVYIFKRH